MKTFVSQYSQRFKLSGTILTVIVVMSLVLLAWGGSAATAVASTKAPGSELKKGPAVHTVKIVEVNGRFAFQPATLTIKAGDIVVWKNTTIAPHTVTSNTGAFNTAGVLSPNHTFSFRFTRGGTFRYHCNIHLYMHGTIIVKGKSGSSQGSSSNSQPQSAPPPPMNMPGYGGGY
jgi:plastocyanin